MSDAASAMTGFADPETLLGRLQRGRGDAVRELLTMPREAACALLLDAVCTKESDDCALLTHRHGFADLVVALRPDLTRWFRWIEALPAELDEPLRLFPFRLLGELALRGHAGAETVLRWHVRGPHWQLALAEFMPASRGVVRTGRGTVLSLDRATWLELLPRVDDETLSLHIDPHDPMWEQLAVDEPRVAACLAAETARRAQLAARTAWSPANYSRANQSHARWRVLQDLLHRDAAAARPLLIDGLWDACWCYREHCVVECDLVWPGVRARLEELAQDERSPAGAAARRRLTGR